MVRTGAQSAAAARTMLVLGLLAPISAAILTLAAIGSVGDGDWKVTLGLTIARGAVLLPGIVYVATGIGLARLLRPMFCGASQPFGIQSAIGAGLMLTLSHVLGQLGVLHGGRGFGVTLAISVVGLGLLFHQGLGFVNRGKKTNSNAAWATIGSWNLVVGIASSILCGFAFGVVLFAVINPPGALWDSEFGAYDALSYHLQLPQEWLAMGRLAPLEHNVYSFLPGYIEAAYLHIAALTFAPTQGGPGESAGLLAGTGWRANACQGLHAAFWFEASMLAGLLARQLMRVARKSTQAVAGDGEQPSDAARASIATRLVQLTPWAVVVGTLAYNEMAMVALFAGALLAASDTGLSPGKRGVISGALVACACGTKATALFLVGVPTGIVLLGTLAPRDWWRAVVPGLLAGLAFLSPWMVRNTIACGNPVFPLALTNWLGTAHWDAEQIARFAKEHISGLPFLEKLGLLILPDSGDPAAVTGRLVFRGITHPQWGVLGALVALAATHAIFWLRGEKQRMAMLLTLAIVAQIALWLLFTHVQSRFLLPLIIPGAAIVALASRSPERPGQPGVRRLSWVAMSALCWCGVLAQAWSLWKAVASQRGGQPGAMIVFEPADFTATPLRGIDTAAREQLMEFSPPASVAAEVPQGERVYLLGDATPFYYPLGVVYHTVWDRWLFRDGTLTDPSIRYVLIDLASIDRYERSGYLPSGVSSEGVRRWMGASTRLIREWPRSGKFLVEVLNVGVQKRPLP